MKKLILLIIPFIFISCSKKEGCLDPSACNYDDKAEIDNGTCTFSEEYFDCDGNCLEEVYDCGDCQQTYFSEIPASVNILSGDNCFNNQDLDVINQVIVLNNLEYISPLEVGTQTWYDGRLRIWIAGNYFSGVNAPLDTLPEDFGNLDDLRSLYLEWNNIKVMPESFENLTNLISLYFSNNGLTNIINNIGNLTNLYNLDLGYNQIQIIPDSFSELNNLQYVWLFNNQIESLPNGFCNLNINWSQMDAAWYPYFAIGGNKLCEDIPECVSNSSHFEYSLDQFYYSFLVEMPQSCED
tara:strand:+ start:900 stop:1787 length:888 start_codon:yes stop_codon:yes gene_type:complete